MAKKIKVEYLPTVGEPYSIKTIKNGRFGNLKTTGETNASRGLCSKGKPQTIRRSMCKKLANISANRIINFQRSTENEVNFANNFLIQHERFQKKQFNHQDQYDYLYYLTNKVISIGKKLARMYGDKYSDCCLKENRK